MHSTECEGLVASVWVLCPCGRHCPSACVASIPMETPLVKILELVFMWADTETEESRTQTGFSSGENPGRREKQSHCLAGFLLTVPVLCAAEGQAQNRPSFVHGSCCFHQPLPRGFQQSPEGQLLTRGSLFHFGCNL